MNPTIMLKLRAFVWYVLSSVWLWRNNLNAAMAANINAIVIPAVATTCKARTINDELNIASNGWTFTIRPFLISKPAGVFINELTDVIKNAENEPPIITGIDMKKCVHLFLNLSQVYK